MNGFRFFFDADSMMSSLSNSDEANFTNDRQARSRLAGRQSDARLIGRNGIRDELSYVDLPFVLVFFPNLGMLTLRKGGNVSE